MTRRLIAYLLCLLPCAALAETAPRPISAGDSLKATPPCPAEGNVPSITEHTWLFGFGKANVLDTYLSPLEYTGPALSLTHRSDRTARWGKGKVSVMALFSAQADYLSSPTDDGKELDADFTAAGGWHYNFRPSKHWRIAVGGLAEFTGGFTYNTRNGNNPAQGRAAIDLAASAFAEYSFRVKRGEWRARLGADVPLAGLMFSPAYGQSYYELFSLGHRDQNICFTYPVNAPSVRLTATLDIPLGGSVLTLGYLADVRQSHVNDLKRHAWRNEFVIGYVRRVAIFRPKKK